MRFRVLGQMEALTDDGPVALGGQKERALLAQLLARPGKVVSVAALVRGLWGDDPPPSAERTLRVYVARLRRALEPDRPRGGPGELLVTREPGYLLRVAPGTLDATRFEQLVGRARRSLAVGAAAAAAATLHEALTLWRGDAFEEFQDTEFGAARARSLAELRLAALEDLGEAELALGRHRGLTVRLEDLVRRHPFRERLWAQLMLALYRSGRRSCSTLRSTPAVPCWPASCAARRRPASSAATAAACSPSRSARTAGPWPRSTGTGGRSCGTRRPAAGSARRCAPRTRPTGWPGWPSAPTAACLRRPGPALGSVGR